MFFIHPTKLSKILGSLLGLLVLKVVFVVILSYRGYLPPNFSSDFLSGRQGYFFGSYRWAFYPHIVSGPLSLVLGILLSSESLRRRWSRWHRVLGRVQILCVLCLVVPSGFVMAWRAESGIVAAFGFAALALVTAACVLLGFRRVLQRRYAEHQAWMQRCLLCLGSAVVIRISGGITTLANLDATWIYPTMAWASWLGPLLGYELYQHRQALKFRAIGVDEPAAISPSPTSKPTTSNDAGRERAGVRTTSNAKVERRNAN